MSQQQQNEEPRPFSQPPSTRGVVRVGLLAALVTFSAFAAYAFLTTPTYRASAQVVIESSGADSSALSPLEAARRLHEAVLDREVLVRFSNEQAPAATPAVHIQIARSIQAAFQIDSVDGRTFSVSFRDSDRDRVQVRCNELAARAVERGPRLLAPERSEAARTLENERRQRVNELVAFLAAHPELANAPKTKEATSDRTDTELRAERARIEARLAPRAAPRSSDNPYDDPATVDIDAAMLTRRLVEINAAIAARTPVAKPSADPVPPQVTAEWQRLLEEVSRARLAATAAKNAPVTFKARLLSRAVAPTWPVEPDRPLLLLLGAGAALIAFAIGALTARAPTVRTVVRAGSSFPPPSGSATSSSFPPAQNLGPSSAPAPDLSSAPPPLPLPGHDARLEMRSPLPQIGEDSGSPSPPPPLPILSVGSSNPAPLPVTGVPSWTASATAYADEEQDAPADPRGVAGNLPAAYSGRRSERAFRAAVEVNADTPAPAVERNVNSSAPPLPSVVPSSARTTQVLGSPIPPIIAPGSRRTPSAGAGMPSTRATPAPRTTSYSYVSTPPPMAPNPAGASSAPPAASSPSPTTISTRPAPDGWRPDLSLLPESRRGLCDQIYPQAVFHCQVIAVLDGGDAGEAKSRLAAELALALAESGHPRVLVMEGNLQRPAVRRFLRVDMPAGYGLSEQLKSRIDAHQRRAWTVVECSPSLHVLAEGANGAPELILSRPFEDCVTELRSFYDFIVLDGPALSDTTACRAVNDVVDCAVLLAGPSAASERDQASALFPAKRVSLISTPR